MKKIIGIMAVAAMATSMFAADISAGTKIKGTLFQYKGSEESISVLGQGNDSHDYANPNFVMSIGDDKAGAKVNITTDGNTTTTAMTAQTIWFKPIDALKITVGNYDVALNKETIDWTQSFTGLGGNGYLVSVNVAGVAIDLGLNEGNGGAFWMTKGKEGDPSIANFFFKVGYSADFGNIGAYLAFNKKQDPKATWEITCGKYDLAEPMSSTIKQMDFGVGYKNTFAPVTMFVNVVGHMEKKFEWIRPEVFASGNVDAFGFSAFVAPIIYVDGDLNKDAECEIVAKLTYAMDACTPYVYFKDANILAKDFACTIKAGATGNCGLMGWNAWVQIDTGTGKNKDKVEVSVPVEFTVSF